MANPFKDIKELTRDVETYLRKNRSSIYNNSKRISDFFEMACYNNIVRFYENNGYEVEIKNLQNNKFNYKCTTAGNPSKYSYFEVKRKMRNLELIIEYRPKVIPPILNKSDKIFIWYLFCKLVIILSACLLDFPDNIKVVAICVLPLFITCFSR